MLSRTTTCIQLIAALSLILFSRARIARAATLCFAETGQCAGDPFGDF